MKRLMLLAAWVLLAGCDYTVPLVKEPDIEIDKAVIGLWQRSNDQGQIEKLLVLPLDEREYLVSYPSNSEEAMFGRACFARVEDVTLVQIKWFGTAEGELPDDNRVFQFAAYSVAEDKLTVRLLNTDVIKHGIATSKELVKAIVAAKDNPQRFREGMVFTRVKG